jgi:hypothetical protein
MTALNGDESKLFAERFLFQAQTVIISAICFRQASFSGNSRTGEEVGEVTV